MEDARRNEIIESMMGLIVDLRVLASELTDIDPATLDDETMACMEKVACAIGCMQHKILYQKIKGKEATYGRS